MRKLIARVLVAATLGTGGFVAAQAATAQTPAHAGCWTGENKPYYGHGRVYGWGWMQCNNYYPLITAVTQIRMNGRGIKVTQHNCHSAYACHAKVSTADRWGNQKWCAEEYGTYADYAGGGGSARATMKCESKSW